MMPIHHSTPFPQKRSRTGKLRLILLLALLSLAALGCKSTSQPVAGKSMNILLITADDLGLQVSAYGETLIQTPNIDSLASAGARFDTAYVAAPSCSPSRASIFTGMYAHSHGHYGLTDTGLALHSYLQNATIPNLLRRAGYRTGLIGKLHVNPESSFQFDYRPAVDARMVRDIHQKASAFMIASVDQPFFLMVNYLDPHAWNNPSQAPTGFISQVDGLPVAPLTPSSAVIFPWQQTNSASHEARTAGYYDAVQRLDAGIGMLMDTLKQSGLLDKTVVLFIGDNGPPFTRGKISVYENGIRTPFLIHWPGVTQAGQVNKAMVSTVDILPTILDAAGVSIPAHVQGMSLRSVLSGTQDPGRPYLIAEHHFHIKNPFFPQRAIRNGRYKLIHNLRAGQASPILGVDGCTAYSISQQPTYTGTFVRTAFNTYANPPEYELYDLQTDPIEFQNLAADPSYQDVLTELKTALAQWRVDTQDPFLDPAVMNSYINFSLMP